MNLNYEKIRAKVEHGGNHWTSYSDLFLVLSVVFLLLYVVANLKSGTGSLAAATALKAAKTEAEDLRKQIKAYEVLRDDYLNKGASKDEIQVYQELMGKLDLLEAEANTERKELFAKAQEAQEKEQQLNHYQQLVRNIINANLVAQARVKKREDIIEQKQTVISQQEKDLGDLTRVVADREQEVQKNASRIREIESQLERKIQEVKSAHRSKNQSEQALQEKIAKLRNASYAQINRLKADNSKVVTELEEKNRQAERLLAQLSEKEAQNKAAAEELTRAHHEVMAREKAAFERGMTKASLTAEAKLKQEQEYRAAVERQNALYNAKLGSLNSDLENTRKNIKAIEGRYQSSLSSLQKSNESLQKSLTASQGKLNEQKLLAQRIKKNFEKSGIHADIDAQTGDVTIQFQNEYFDTGRADLKNGMRSTLERLLPVYAKSLMQDDKVAKKIGSVEIVGFASPTFRGKYVDPDSLSPEDRTAVNFNMDLSYQRAKSIFEYVFDPQKMTFPHQKDLLPLIKVSGRSYLATDRSVNRQPGSFKDTAKSQKVIIKFNLRDE